MDMQKIKDIAKVKSQIAEVRKSENLTIKTLSAITPEIIEGVIAGDNVSIVNSLLTALKGSRRKDIAFFVRAMLPHNYNKERGTFGKKLTSGQQVKAKIDAFIAFKESGMTVFEWLDTKLEHEIDKEIDWNARVRSQLSKAIEKGGLSPVEILGILESLVPKAADAEIPFEDVAGKAA